MSKSFLNLWSLLKDGSLKQKVKASHQRKRSKLFGTQNKFQSIFSIKPRIKLFGNMDINFYLSNFFCSSLVSYQTTCNKCLTKHHMQCMYCIIICSLFLSLSCSRCMSHAEHSCQMCPTLEPKRIVTHNIGQIHGKGGDLLLILSIARNVM